MKALYNGRIFRTHEVTEDVFINCDAIREVIHIPKGFQTDGRSSFFLAPFLPPWGRAARPSLVHDKFYQERRNRLRADYLFLLLLFEYNPIRPVINKYLKKVWKINYWPVFQNVLSFLLAFALGWILYLLKPKIND